MRKGYVSIIIPVYNCIPYLKQCLNSVMKQTYKNLEIILIDDGSNDGSSEMCDEFQIKDDRFQVYHLELHNVSAVRNYGLSKATGEYVLFVDSDDEIKPHMVHTMVTEIVEKNVDMVICNYKKKLKRWLVVANSCQDEPGIYRREEYLKHTLRDPGHHYYGVVWNKLYRHSIIAENHLRFCEEVCLGEDFIFSMDYWKQIDRISVIGEQLYVYNRMQKRSLSKQSHQYLTDCEKELRNRKIIYSHYVSIMKENGFYDTHKKGILHYWIVFYVRQIVQTTIGMDGWTLKQKKFWEKTMQEDDLIKEALQCYSKQYVSEEIKKFRKNYQLKRRIKRILRVY